MAGRSQKGHQFVVGWFLRLARDPRNGSERSSKAEPDSGEGWSRPEGNKKLRKERKKARKSRKWMAGVRGLRGGGEGRLFSP